MDVGKRTALISMLIFTLSLCFTAFTIEDMGEIKNYKSLEIFLIGPISSWVVEYLSFWYGLPISGFPFQ